MPKGAGYNHLEMFKSARTSTPADDRVKCMVIFGQNPAVTEPNLGLIKQGLYDLEILVVVDMFETETAACPRNPTGITYLLPSCSFVEEEGSVTNSSRWIQWRYRAIYPQGGSKSDMEILLRLANKLDEAGSFSHTPIPTGYTNRYMLLYGEQYGWNPADGISFNNVAGLVAENIFIQMSNNNVGASLGTDPENKGYGALWIYKGAWNSLSTPKNRAKSRNTKDTSSGSGLYPNWGWAWPGNCRILYNNGRVRGDVNDSFVSSDKVARLYVHFKDDSPPSPVSYSNTLRAYSKLSDTNAGNGSTTGGVRTATQGARMPKHWELHESPRPDLKTKYGTTGDGPTNPSGSNGDYPLVLTTFRVTEHFQGGPMSRNIPWLCELVPEAIIEINSVDAYKYSIKTGDNVYIDTPRASNIGPFKAVVGMGSQENQRVAAGYVAVPWHWGNRGLKTGPSANTGTIDALDTNVKTPEYKACLCRIRKV
jgi:formate dehydrogenase major subunit